MSTLRLRNVAKNYGRAPALRGVSFEVAAGQLAVLVGPSGCGKTTTLRLIAGLERPGGGEIHLGEKELTKLAPHERGVAMVFQSPALYPHLSVERNLSFPLRLSRLARQETDRRVNNAADLLGLRNLLGRRPDELSGGEQQRVALGKVIVQEPRLWLFDEPLASLDAPLRRQLAREIVGLQRKTGTTTLFVTHDQAEALSYGDWLIVMRGGEIQQVGTPDDVYAHPANRFVAGFLGDPPMNLLRGEMRQGCFRTESLTVGLPPDVPDGPIEIGIRPEDVVLSAAEEDGALRGVVERVEFRGHAFVAEIHIGNETLMVRRPRDAAFASGTSVHLTLPREKIDLFQADRDGRRLGGGESIATPP